MKSFKYAIEIGGSLTKIYVKDEGYALCEPTLICAQPTFSGYEIVAMGQNAKDLIGRTNETAEAFSPISNGKIINYEYLKQLLIYFFEKLEFKKNKDRIVVLTNCGLKEEDQEEFLNLLYEIGFLEVQLVPAVVCSLLGAGRNVSSTKTNMIVNIGGANTDIAVVNMNSIVKGATLGLGGRAVDVAIANTIAYNHGLIIGTPTCEKLKMEVGSLYPNDALNMEVNGLDADSKLPKPYIISAEDIAIVLEPFFEEIVRSIDVTITSLAPEMTTDIVKSGIVFAGGMSQVAGLEHYLKTHLRYPFKIVEDADNVTILGAGKLLNDEELLSEIIENV